MLKQIFNLFRTILLGKKFGIKSFTFYIPGPPARKHSYREKQFDRVFEQFMNKGFKIIDIKTEQHTSTVQSGMWFICIVEPLNANAAALRFDDISFDGTDATPLQNADKTVEVEGLYHIKSGE